MQYPAISGMLFFVFVVIVAHFLPLSHLRQRGIRSVCPFASDFNERCKCTTLTTNRAVLDVPL